MSSIGKRRPSKEKNQKGKSNEATTTMSTVRNGTL